MKNMPTKIFAIIFALLINCQNPSLAFYRTDKAIWDAFLLEHTLDPDAYINANYLRWTTYDWENWLCMKDPLHYYYKGETLSQKYLNTVIVGNSDEVDKAFEGPLVHYGHRGSGMAWSNRPFQTFIVMRDGRHLKVFECGDLYVAAKLRRGLPVSIETTSVAPYYYEYESKNFYNYNRLCYRVPDN